MPVIGYLVKAMDSLPVYRRQDEGQDVSKNQETFIAARKLLARGGTIGICPEGVSHDAPGSNRSRPAPRVSRSPQSQPAKSRPEDRSCRSLLHVKTSFRSDALLYFGTPIDVEPVKLEPDGTPPRDTVRQLSNEIEKRCAK